MHIDMKNLEMRVWIWIYDLRLPPFLRYVLVGACLAASVKDMFLETIRIILLWC